MKIEEYLLDRVKSKKALDDGFCIVFGEKHRKFLKKIGGEIIELGMANGKEWCNNLLLCKSDRLYSYFEMAETGIFEKEKIDDIVKHLQVFFTDEDIDKLKRKNRECDEYAGAYMKGLDKYEKIITDTIKEKDVTLKSAKPFDYFKKFCRSDKKEFASVTLYGEGGLGLDEYNPISLKYMKEEGELCYPLESVCRKYHYLGMLLMKDEILQHWVDKIRSNMTEKTNYFVKSYLASVIYQFSLSSISDKIIIDIQNQTCVTDGFMTHKQVSDSLSKI